MKTGYTTNLKIPKSKTDTATTVAKIGDRSTILKEKRINQTPENANTQEDLIFGTVEVCDNALLLYRASKRE